MLLSELIEKQIIVQKQPRGVVKGVGISLKTHAVIYLLCAESAASRPLFALSANAVSDFDESIVLPRLRPLLPKQCACIFLGLPVYSYEGAFLGNVTDLAMQNLTASTLFTDQNAAIPIACVAACSDALLLKKEQAYPLGQRVPAPMLSSVSEKTGDVVTKPILRAAIEKKSLIKLTLALPPFSQTIG